MFILDYVIYRIVAVIYYYVNWSGSRKCVIQSHPLAETKRTWQYNLQAIKIATQDAERHNAFKTI